MSTPRASIAARWTRRRRRRQHNRCSNGDGRGRRRNKSGALRRFFIGRPPGIGGDCVYVYCSRYLLPHGWRCLMKIDLTGKTALVTGSTSGIGHAVARGLAAVGAEVVVNGRAQGKVDAVVAAIRKAVPGAKVRGLAADVSTAAGCKTLVPALPRGDILLNNPRLFDPNGFFQIPP